MSDHNRAPMFPEGVNPRGYLSNHSERGAKRFTYTLQDVASVLGVSKRTLRRWRAASSHPFDPADLESICRLWAARGERA